MQSVPEAVQEYIVSYLSLSDELLAFYQVSKTCLTIAARARCHLRIINKRYTAHQWERLLCVLTHYYPHIIHLCIKECNITGTSLDYVVTALKQKPNHGNQNQNQNQSQNQNNHQSKNENQNQNQNQNSGRARGLFSSLNALTLLQCRFLSVNHLVGQHSNWLLFFAQFVKCLTIARCPLDDIASNWIVLRQLRQQQQQHRQSPQQLSSSSSSSSSSASPQNGNPVRNQNQSGSLPQIASLSLRVPPASARKVLCNFFPNLTCFLKDRIVNEIRLTSYPARLVLNHLFDLGFPNLETLALTNTALYLTSLEFLCHLPSLKYLFLGGCQMFPPLLKNLVFSFKAHKQTYFYAELLLSDECQNVNSFHVLLADELNINHDQNNDNGNDNGNGNNNTTMNMNIGLLNIHNHNHDILTRDQELLDVVEGALMLYESTLAVFARLIEKQNASENGSQLCILGFTFHGEQSSALDMKKPDLLSIMRLKLSRGIRSLIDTSTQKHMQTMKNIQKKQNKHTHGNNIDDNNINPIGFESQSQSQSQSQSDSEHDEYEACIFVDFHKSVNLPQHRVFCIADILRRHPKCQRGLQFAINQSQNRWLQNILHRNCELGDAAYILQLLQNKVYCDRRDGRGATALFRAAFFNQLECCRHLLRFGADALKRKMTKETPIATACLNRNIPMVKLMLDSYVHGHGSDSAHGHGHGHGNASRIHLLNDPREYDNGWTPAHCACAARDLNLLRILVSEYGLSCDVQNGYGLTPLHICAKQNAIPCARYLIGRYSAAALRLREEYGNTAQDFAWRKFNAEIERLIAQRLQALKRNGFFVVSDGGTAHGNNHRQPANNNNSNSHRVHNEYEFHEQREHQQQQQLLRLSFNNNNRKTQRKQWNHQQPQPQPPNASTGATATKLWDPYKKTNKNTMNKNKNIKGNARHHNNRRHADENQGQRQSKFYDHDGDYDDHRSYNNNNNNRNRNRNSNDYRNHNNQHSRQSQPQKSRQDWRNGRTQPKSNVNHYGDESSTANDHNHSKRNRNRNRDHNNHRNKNSSNWDTDGNNWGRKQNFKKQNEHRFGELQPQPQHGNDSYTQDNGNQSNKNRNKNKNRNRNRNKKRNKNRNRNRNTNNGQTNTNNQGINSVRDFDNGGANYNRNDKSYQQSNSYVYRKK